MRKKSKKKTRQWTKKNTKIIWKTPAGGKIQEKRYAK